VYVFINVISGIVFTPFLIKSVGQSQYGLYEIVASLASNLSLLNFGMSDSVVKYVTTYKAEGNLKKQGEVVGAIIKVLSIASAIAGVICIVFYVNFDVMYASSLTAAERAQGKIMFIVAALNLMVSLPGGTFSSVLCAYEQFGITRLMGILKTLSRMLLLFVFLHFTTNAMLILAVDTLLNIGIILVDIILVRVWLKVPVCWKTSDRSLYKSIFSFSAYVVFFMIAREVQFQTDKTIIGLRMSTAWVTIYAAGSKISATFNQLGQILSSMYLPRAIRIKKETKDDHLEAAYRGYMVSMGRLLLPIISAVMIGFVGMGNAFMTLWIGEGYEVAYVSASVMMLALFLPIVEDTGLAILKAENKQSTIATAWLVSSILNVILTWIAVPYLGIVGASIMTLLTSYGVNMVVLNVSLKKEIGLKVRKLFENIFKGSIPVCAGSALFFWIWRLLEIQTNNWFTFCCEGVIFMSIYGVLVYTCYLNQAEKQAVNQRLRKMTGKLNSKV
jgi:O-antigen/teichoic acid export membrane protein